MITAGGTRSDRGSILGGEVKSGQLDAENIDEEAVSDHLYTASPGGRSHDSHGW